ncbi:MAG TPA: response regulator [Cyclobacteriaceae bacterium]|nr:response regulator [Cyclobacteriaceae bacterium]
MEDVIPYLPMSQLSKSPFYNILLADDDNDDCLLFTDALNDMPLVTQLTTVRHGEELMLHLHAKEELPDLLFLDLNMPRKNGFECLIEIKQSEKLSAIPVIIFSTSFEPDIVKRLYRNGARYYICKPNAFDHLVILIHRAITVTLQENHFQIPMEKFVLSPESCFNESFKRKSAFKL